MPNRIMNLCTNLKRQCRVSSSRGNARQHGILIIPQTLISSLNNYLRCKHSIQIQGLHIRLLSHGPLTTAIRIFPARIIPIIHMIRQQNHRQLQLKVSSPQPGKQQLRLRRRGAALRREKLHQHSPALTLLLTGDAGDGLVVMWRGVRGGGWRRRSFAEARDKAASTPHWKWGHVSAGEWCNVNDQDLQAGACIYCFLLFLGWIGRRIGDCSVNYVREVER